MSDLIERQAAIEAIDKRVQFLKDDPVFRRKHGDIDLYGIKPIIRALPSAQPDLDEWCTDCKEYDSEKHHCPRYNKVIREALKGAEPRKPGKWEFIGDNMFECTNCEVVYTTNQLNGLRNYDTDPYAPKFCPNCGADMRGEQNEPDK